MGTHTHSFDFFTQNHPPSSKAPPPSLPHKKGKTHGHDISVSQRARVAVKEAWALAKLCYFYPQSKPQPVIEKDFSKKNDLHVVFIHGYLHNNSGWEFHREKLEESMKAHTYAPNLGTPFQSIAEKAAKVDSLVHEIFEKTGSRNIVLVGHSLGGVVASHASTYLNQDKLIQKVITLASPLRGTPKYHYAFGECIEEINPDCISVKNLVSRIEKNKSVGYYNVGCIYDLMVPYEYALVGSNSKKHMVTDNEGHLSTLFSDDVAEFIAKSIRGS